MTPRDHSLALIMECCCAHGVHIRDVLSPNRSKAVTQARHAAMHRLSDERRLSTTQIGRIMGRDHSTVVHALARKRRGYRNAE